MTTFPVERVTTFTGLRTQIEAANLEQALARAVDAADADTDGWDFGKEVPVTFCYAAAPGAHDARRRESAWRPRPNSELPSEQDAAEGEPHLPSGAVRGRVHGMCRVGRCLEIPGRMPMTENPSRSRRKRSAGENPECPVATPKTGSLPELELPSIPHFRASTGQIRRRASGAVPPSITAAFIHDAGRGA